MKLTQYIADLLLKNNCVIIPEFGGFIANYQPAVIDELRQKIYPPSKQVLFNTHLISNDGLLANYVANQINTTYPNALSLIKIDVEFWKTNLKKGKRINIGEIGFLYFENHQIKFEQHKSFNLLLSAYGLSEIKFITELKEEVKPVVSQPKAEPKKHSEANKQTKLKPITVNTLQNVVSKVESKPKIDKDTKVVTLQPKKRKKNWKYIAVACALPLLFYSYWIPMNTNVLETGNIKASDFNPFGQKASKSYSEREHQSLSFKRKQVKTWEQLTEKINSSVKVYNYQLADDLYIPVLLSHSKEQAEISTDSEQETNTVEETKILVTESIAASSSKNIHLISGCFSDKHNAETFVKELNTKGYNAHIVDKNKGLYRVSAQSFDSKSEAKSFKDKLTNDGYSSWILKK